MLSNSIHFWFVVTQHVNTKYVVLHPILIHFTIISSCENNADVPANYGIVLRQKVIQKNILIFLAI